MNKAQFNKYVRKVLEANFYKILEDKSDRPKNLRKTNPEEADYIIDMFIENLLLALREENEVSLVGFGRFYKTQTKARTGRNPKTGEPIKIAAYVQPRFTAGIKLKKACNKKEKTKNSKK